MKKLLAILLVALLVLTGCSSGGKVNYVSDYSYVYTTDIETLDYTASMRSVNADHTQNFVDTLYELDNLGNLIPALAESYEVSEDGLTYTFKIREGVKWVTNTGDEYAEVTAHDFVYGMKHAAEVNSEMLGIVTGIVGLAEFARNPKGDFANVGVKATDDYTLEYTLSAPESFFLTKINYGIFQPVHEDFVVSRGGAANFGTVDPDSILYNGPFLLTNNTSKSAIEYVKNAAYWDVENVHLDNVKFIFTELDNPGELYNGFASGNYSQARVYPNDPTWETIQKDHKDNVIFSDLNGVVYNFNWNLNRRSFNNTSKDAGKQAETHKAILNKDFRQAVNHAFSREDYNAQSVGKDAAKQLIRNDFLPPEFASVYHINDEVDYQKLVLEELKAIDAHWDGYDLSDGQDAFFNVDTAKAFADKAKTALTAEGVSFPVVLDLPYYEASQLQVQQAQSFKKSVEDALGKDFVEINIVGLAYEQYLAATYNAKTGADSDYDLSNASGWGPDYGDPSTYLNIYNSYNGDMLGPIGLDNLANPETVDESAAVREALDFATYDAILKEANAEQDTAKRLALFAKADAWMVDAGIQMPSHGQGGTPSVTKIVPFTRAYGWTGNGDVRFKFIKIQEEPVTAEQYNKLKADWEKARAK